MLISMLIPVRTHCSVLLHAVERHSDLDGLAALLGQFSLQNSRQSVIRYSPQNSDAFLNHANQSPLFMTIVYRQAPAGSPLIVSGSSNSSLYLDPSQKKFAYRIRQAILEKVSALNAIDGGLIPLLETTRLSSPSLLIYVPSDLNFSEFLNSLSQFLSEQFEPVIPLVQKVQPAPVPDSPQKYAESAVTPVVDTTHSTPAQTSLNPEEAIRREVMSWITLESDDESWMAAFEPFRAAPPSKQIDPSRPSTITQTSQNAVPNQKENLSNPFLDEESMQLLSEELYNMSNILKSGMQSTTITTSATSTMATTVITIELDLSDPPDWLVGQ